MKKSIVFINILVMGLIFFGCAASDDSDAAFSKGNPKNIQSGEVYSLYIYEDDESAYNKSYLKFVPQTTNYFSIHLGTKDSQDLDIKIYSDDEYISEITLANRTSLKGEYLSFHAKKNQTYYILILNYDNSEDVDYDLLISSSLSDGFYSKELPLTMQLKEENQMILAKIGYDSSSVSYDDNEDKLYMKVVSKITKTLYIKTQTLDANQDLDIKVYSDSNYTSILYETSSGGTTQESLSIDFNVDTTYYIEILNFTNAADTDITLAIENFNF